MRDLGALPKAHLHLHLEGAMRPATLAELAAGYGMAMPSVRGYGTFAAFAGMYIAACEVIRSPDDLRRVVREVVEDAAVDGAGWVEPALYAPRHSHRLGSVEAVIEIALDALAGAGAELGVGTGLLLAADRTEGPADAEKQALLAARYRDRGVVGLGLANDESRFPPQPFAAAFGIAKRAGLRSVPHAGELAGPASVIGALDALNADRIQHGVRSIEDPELVSRLADSRVCLDVCPTSNLALSVVPSVDAHPLPALLAAGVRCSVNADDPLLFGPGLLEEYRLCRQELGLDDPSMAHIARCSIEASAAPGDLKRRLLGDVDAWLAGPAGGEARPVGE
jgi:adenosine deaminase